MCWFERVFWPYCGVGFRGVVAVCFGSHMSLDPGFGNVLVGVVDDDCFWVFIDEVVCASELAVECFAVRADVLEDGLFWCMVEEVIGFVERFEVC